MYKVNLSYLIVSESKEEPKNTQGWSCTYHVTDHVLTTCLIMHCSGGWSCTDQEADHTLITWLCMHNHVADHPLITLVSYTDHETDHAHLTCLIITDHVADHALFTKTPRDRIFLFYSFPKSCAGIKPYMLGCDMDGPSVGRFSEPCTRFPG